MSNYGVFDNGIRSVQPGAPVRSLDHNRMGREVSYRSVRGSPDVMASKVGNGTTLRTHNNEFGHPFRVFQVESFLFVNNGSVFHAGAGTMIADRRVLPPNPKEPTDTTCDDGTNTQVSRGGEYIIDIQYAKDMYGEFLVTDAEWTAGVRKSSGDKDLHVFCFPIGSLSETKYVWMDMSGPTPKIKYSYTDEFAPVNGVCIASILKDSGIIVQSVFSDIYDPIKKSTHPFKVTLKQDKSGVVIGEGRAYGYNVNNWWNSGNKEAEAIGEPGAVLWDSLKTYYLETPASAPAGNKNFLLDANGQSCKWYSDNDSIDANFPGTTSSDWSVYLYLYRDIRLGSQIYGAEFKPQGQNIKPQDPFDVEVQCTWQVRIGFTKTRNLLAKKYDTEKPSDYKTNSSVGRGSYRMDGWKCDRFGAVGCDSGYGADYIGSSDYVLVGEGTVLGPDLTETPAADDTNCCSSNIVVYDNVTLSQNGYEYHLKLKKEYLNRIYSFWSGGGQYYEIARIVAKLKTDKDGNVVKVKDKDGNDTNEDEVESRSVRQFLRSDFFFYPPADAYFSAVLTKVTLENGDETSAPGTHAPDFV